MWLGLLYVHGACNNGHVCLCEVKGGNILEESFWVCHNTWRILRCTFGSKVFCG